MDDKKFLWQALCVSALIFILTAMLAVRFLDML